MLFLRSTNILAILAIILFLSRCGINRQVQQAKNLSKSRFALQSADSTTIADYPVEVFKDIRQLEDVNPLRYPRIAAGLLERNIPFKTNLNLEITNPTNDTAAINAFEYRLLLGGSELANGHVDQRIVVPPGGGKALAFIPVNANAYGLLTNSSTRNAFINLARSLAGSSQVSPSRVTLKIKPTFVIGNKAVTYPGFISIDKEVNRDLLLKAGEPASR